MDNKLKTCVVSVAFRKPYVQHSIRQEEYIRNVNPEIDLILFRDQLPMKDRIETNDIVGHFQKSLYGFKPHAIQHAIDAGYKKVIWLDPSVLPVNSLQILVDSLNVHPMIVRTGDQPILGMVNERAKKWFGITDEQLIGINHIGGTIYAFNFNFEDAKHTFNIWKRAEEEGIFGTQDDFMSGHWADEACMTLAMRLGYIEQYYEQDFKYLNQKEL